MLPLLTCLVYRIYLLVESILFYQFNNLQIIWHKDVEELKSKCLSSISTFQSKTSQLIEVIKPTSEHTRTEWEQFKFNIEGKRDN